MATLTPFPAVDALVDTLHPRIRAALGGKLVGLYLAGSLATGGFSPDVSDVDLVAAISADPDERELADLQALHEEVARDSGEWGDRIDVAYLTVVALRGSTSGYRYPAVFDREPLHFEAAGSDLTIARHVLWKQGIAVAGPAPRALVEPVSRDDLVRAVRQACLGEWRPFVEDIHTRNEQAFWILLMCRALYTVREADVISKPAASLWAQRAYPEWSAAIRRALGWWQDASLWRNGRVPFEATLPETRRFVSFAVERIVGAA